MLETQRHAQEVHSRLRKPVNAVHDNGIDLKRLPPGFKWQDSKRFNAEKTMLIPIANIQDVQDVPIRIIKPPEYRLGVGDKVSVIIAVVAEATGIPRDKILGPARNRPIGRARHIAMFLARYSLNQSYPKLARYFRKDHSSLVHAVQKIEGVCRDSTDVAFEIASLETSIRALIGVRP